MKSTPPHPGNRFICTSGIFDRIRFSLSVGILALGFSTMLCVPAMAQTSPVPSSAGTLPPTESVDSLVDEASRRFSIPALWIRSVMQVESGGNAQALSPKGAIGLMQIMPETYAALRQAFGLGADPYQPRDNIMAGAAYLREMLDLYGTSGFLAAYNAGPARYNEHLETGEPPPEETQIYLSRLTPMFSGSQVGSISAAANPVTWMSAPLFLDDNAMSNSGAVQDDNGGSPNAHPRPNQQPINATTSTAIAALAPQSSGLFINVSAGSMAQSP
jgi:soluble lytic murein transglycosylase-like protein